jgi:hypothetical protein
MTANPSVSSPPVPATKPDLVYVNGINPETGKYAVPPMSLADLAKQVRFHPGGAEVTTLRQGALRSFALFNKGLDKPNEVGWAVVFHEDTPQAVRDALAPLVEHRRKQVGDLFKVLDYHKGEQSRDWYRRHQMTPGNLEPEVVPYYLLLVGPPGGIPFEFQYLVGVEYAVGRLDFDPPADYDRYARSVVAYEAAAAVKNAKEIVYWGTRHLGDPATNLSASNLVDPLANGIAGAKGALKTPLHVEVGFDRKVYLGDDALKENLLASLRRDRPPALLFTASHGMQIDLGRPNQLSDQGGLVCQDWPGYGNLRPEHKFMAADVPDDANLSGMVAFTFACFSAGTPSADQFLMDLSDAGTAPPLAPQPFTAALPRRLLSHPNGTALAVIGHVDRAWEFSIQPTDMAGAHIGPFRQGLGFILTGAPVGHALALQFGQRYAALSTALLTAVAPTTPAAMRPTDRDLVTYWLERNDAQNYVMLGDPAVRLRAEALA